MSAFAKVRPSALPRSQRAPVALTVGFDSRFSESSEVPALERIVFTLAPAFSFEKAGLPVCRVPELYDTEPGADPCRGSLVGSGAVDSEIAVPGRAPVVEEGRLRAFYGRGRGSPMILAQVTTAAPEPLVYVIPFFLWEDEESGSYSIRAYRMRRILGKCIGRCGGPGPYSFEGIYTRISHLDMSLHRIWSSGGRERSFVRARCSTAGARPVRMRVLLARLGYDQGFGPGIDEAFAGCRPKA
jgi:hypothetical protein